MYVQLRTDSFAKLFFLITSTGLLLYIILAFYTYHTAFVNVSHLRKYQNRRGLPNPSQSTQVMNRIKNILIWKTENKTSNKYEEGMFLFIDNKCPYTNCYLTSNKDLLNEDYKNFDAIVFDTELLKNWRKVNLPLSRLEKQKYIFYSTIPSNELPVCNIMADEYFNWTCTYKLDSDIVNPFIEVYDWDGNVIAPKNDVKWEKDISKLTIDDTKVFGNKTKAMAWIVDKCVSNYEIYLFAKRLQEAFRQTSLVFDIFGCGFKSCPNDECSNILHNYYFYYAVEESDSEDYVTDAVVNAYHAFAVPIVKGETNYQKFLPDGSYINIGNGSIDKVVATVDYIIRNPTVFYTFHRWRKHYHIRKANPFQGFCKICEYLNDEDKFGRISIKTNFRKWWHKGPLFERCFPRSAERYSDLLSYKNETRKYEDVKLV